MKITLSRHSKRRLKLYKISDGWIYSLLAEAKCEQGQHTILTKHPGIKLPIKVIYVVEEEEITLITAYPLKKGIK